MAQGGPQAQRRALSQGALDAIGGTIPTRALTALALAGQDVSGTRVLTAERLSALRHFARDGPAGVCGVAPEAVLVVNVRSLSTEQFGEVQELFPNVERVNVTLLKVILDASRPWAAPRFAVDFDHAIVFVREEPAASARHAWALQNVAPASGASVTLCVALRAGQQQLPEPPWAGPFACGVLIFTPYDDANHQSTGAMVLAFLRRHSGPAVICIDHMYGATEEDVHAHCASIAGSLQADAASAAARARARPVLVSLAPPSSPALTNNLVALFASAGPHVMAVSEGVCASRSSADGALVREKRGFEHFEARYRGDTQDALERALFSTFDGAFAAHVAAFLGGAVPPSVFHVELIERHRDNEIASEVIEHVGLAQHVLALHDVTRATVVALARRTVAEPHPADALTACRKVHELYAVCKEFFTFYPMRKPSPGCGYDAQELRLLDWCSEKSREVAPDATTFAHVTGNNFVVGYIRARMFATARRIVELCVPAASVLVDRSLFPILRRDDDEQRAFMLELLATAEAEVARAAGGSRRRRPMEFDRVREFFGAAAPEEIAAVFEFYQP